MSQPINAPVLDHIDLIRGMVSGYKTPGTPDYAGEWPRNTDWLRADGTTADLSVVPPAVKNTTAEVNDVHGVAPLPLKVLMTAAVVFLAAAGTADRSAVVPSAPASRCCAATRPRSRACPASCSR